MLVYPDFYPEFHCLAGDCRNSCCRGWEIDIDEESLRRYDAMDGEWGERLRREIERDGTPRFRLTEEENCPFLRRDGLCEMILSHGEESLCDICREHPRFYNELPGRTEVGLGLCCEEAVRLLLQGKEPLRLMAELEHGEKPTAPLPPVRERARVFAALRERDIPLLTRMERAMKGLGGELTSFDACHAGKFLLSLEIMDAEWAGAVRWLTGLDENEIRAPEGIAFERIAEYFIFRHYVQGKTSAERRDRAQLAFFLTRLLAALEGCEYLPTPMEELTRLCSAELEYSEENTAAVLVFAANPDKEWNEA